jgi:hypothetical protein
LSVWPSLLTSYSVSIYAKHSLYWGREETSSSPLPHNFPSPKSNTVYIHIIRSIWNAYMLCPVRICKHEGKQKYLLRMHGRAGSASAPFSRSVAGAVGGGGGGAGGPGPAWDLEQGRGDLCLVS